MNFLELFWDFVKLGRLAKLRPRHNYVRLAKLGQWIDVRINWARYTLPKPIRV